MVANAGEQDTPSNGVLKLGDAVLGLNSLFGQEASGLECDFGTAVHFITSFGVTILAVFPRTSGKQGLFDDALVTGNAHVLDQCGTGLGNACGMVEKTGTALDGSDDCLAPIQIRRRFKDTLAS